MKYVIFVIDDRSNSADENEMSSIDQFNEYLQENGHWIYACGIVDSRHAKTIDFRDDNQLITNESINSGSDFISGFWIIDAIDQDQAENLAKQGSHACNRRVELRAQL